MAPHDIEERTFRFACDTVHLCRFLITRGPILRRLAYQLLDAGTSVGSNAEEATGAQSRADFVAKCAVVRKEARESRFWLRLFAAVDPQVVDRTGPLATEATQLVAIFNASIKTARSHAKRR